MPTVSRVRPACMASCMATSERAIDVERLLEHQNHNRPAYDAWQFQHLQRSASLAAPLATWVAPPRRPRQPMALPPMGCRHGSSCRLARQHHSQPLCLRGSRRQHLGYSRCRRPLLRAPQQQPRRLLRLPAACPAGGINQASPRGLVHQLLPHLRQQRRPPCLHTSSQWRSPPTRRSSGRSPHLHLCSSQRLCSSRSGTRRPLAPVWLPLPTVGTTCWAR